MENKITTRTQKIPPLLYIAISLIMAGYAYGMISLRIRVWYKNCQDITSWEVGDFITNYQGGFVRRGLLGELLFKINQIFPDFDPRWFVAISSMLCFIILVGFLLKKFRNEGLCWWILPLNVCVSGGFLIGRKDHMCMIFALLILYAFSKPNSVKLRYILVIALSIFSINLHECTFFIIGCFMLLAMIKDKSTQWGWKLLGTASIIVCMAFVCTHKGDKEIAQQIWDSWGTYHSEFVNTSPKRAIHAIGWETINTFKFHLEQNFFKPEMGIYIGLAKPLIWILIFFVFPNIIFIKRDRLTIQQSPDTIRLLSIMMIQFIALFPMFTILSCDGSRISYYWTVSSLLIYLCIPGGYTLRLIPQPILKLAEKTTRIIFFKNSTSWAIFCLSFISIAWVGTNIRFYFYNSVIGVYYSYMKQLITLMLNF